ncbi:hypothetical protein Ahy_B01g051685 [Arachis hypogaea]|uniref:Major facilitator superfamily (MFS) profile domain-containing protein n=2 Tax=Arachis TaxID=3817 RepID=A0A445AMS2_ARAHY|nr:hypothetical protein Ahy_B01g051685 [Arachis hypogaea]
MALGSGALNNRFQLSITVGILVANVLNYFFANIKGGWGWRLSFGGAMVSALIITIGSLVLPDTPNSMIECGEHEKTTQQLRKVPDVEDIDEELFQLSITVGILVANVLNYFFANIKGGWGWRLSFGGAMVSALIITIRSLVLPDTSNSMIERGEHEKTTQQLRKVPDVEDIDEELFQLSITVEILVANLLNYFFANIKGEWGWRLSFGGAMVSALIITIGSLVLLDTPNSMIERGEHEKATQQLRKVPDVEDIDEEFNDLIAASEESKKEKLKRALNIGFQLSITVGILVANVLNYFFANIKGGWGWRLSFGGAMVSALIITIGSLVLPDTPNSMIERGEHEKARQQLRKVPGVEDIDEEFNDLIAASEESKKVKHPWRNLLQRKYRPHLTMAIMIPFFQQFTGIIVIMFCAPVLFGSIGFKDNYALMSAVITGVINVAATVVSIYGVDKWGRRALFLEGRAQMIICQAVVAAAIGAKFGIDGNPGDLPVWYAIVVMMFISIYV